MRVALVYHLVDEVDRCLRARHIASAVLGSDSISATWYACISGRGGVKIIHVVNSWLRTQDTDTRHGHTETRILNWQARGAGLILFNVLIMLSARDSNFELMRSLRAPITSICLFSIAWEEGQVDGFTA